MRKLQDRVKEKVKEAIKDNIKERVKDNIKQHIKEHVVEHISEKLSSHHQLASRDLMRAASKSLENGIIDSLLKEGKYRAIFNLVAHIKDSNAEVNVYNLILDRALDTFLTNYTHSIGYVLTNQVRACLQDFYHDYEQRVNSKHAQPLPPVSRQASFASTAYTSAQQHQMLTLALLKSAETVADKLSLLQANYGRMTGWSMGSLLIKNENWTGLNEYILILSTLPKPDVEAQFRRRDASNKTFIELLITKNVTSKVIFNLLVNFTIQEDDVRKIARISNLKENVKLHIETLGLIQQNELELWQQCVKKETTIGKFFMTPRRALKTLGLSKFNSNDYAKTEIVNDIIALIKRLETNIKSINSIRQAPGLLRSNQVSFFTDIHDHSRLTQTASSNTINNHLSSEDSYNPLFIILIVMGGCFCTLLFQLYSAGSFDGFWNENKEDLKNSLT